MYRQVEALRRQEEEKRDELKELLATSKEDMWRGDLDAFLEALEVHELAEKNIGV